MIAWKIDNDHFSPIVDGRQSWGKSMVVAKVTTLTIESFSQSLVAPSKHLYQTLNSILNSFHILHFRNAAHHLNVVMWNTVTRFSVCVRNVWVMEQLALRKTSVKTSLDVPGVAV